MNWKRDSLQNQGWKRNLYLNAKFSPQFCTYFGSTEMLSVVICNHKMGIDS